METSKLTTLIEIDEDILGLPPRSPAQVAADELFMRRVARTAACQEAAEIKAEQALKMFSENAASIMKVVEAEKNPECEELLDGRYRSLTLTTEFECPGCKGEASEMLAVDEILSDGGRLLECKRCKAKYRLDMVGRAGEPFGLVLETSYLHNVDCSSAWFDD